MTTPITFYNPGEIDLRVISTMGVNVKPDSAAPIGYFGTGLKYAIAVLLRHQQQVVIWSGWRRLELAAAPEVIRGKEFSVVQMREGDGAWQPLGFTTDLGRNWTLENAYRELYSNAKDEGGSVLQGSERVGGGLTNITVTGEKFYDVWLRRDEIILNSERRPLAVIPGVLEVYNGASHRVFYRGIAAYQSGGEQFRHTYNILHQETLSEDRMLNSIDVDWVITAGLTQCDDESILEAAYGAKDAPEANTSFINSRDFASEFYIVVERVMRERPLDLSPNVITAYRRKRPVRIERVECQLQAHELQVLAEAQLFTERLGLGPSPFPVKIADSLGQHILALAEDGVIWLARGLVRQPELRAALVEEFIHLDRKVEDCTREMQNELFREIVRLGERALRAEGPEGTNLDAEGPR